MAQRTITMRRRNPWRTSGLVIGVALWASACSASTNVATTQGTGSTPPGSVRTPTATGDPGSPQGCGTPLATGIPQDGRNDVVGALRSWNAMTGPPDGSGEIRTTVIVFKDGTAVASAPDGTARILRVEDTVLSTLRHGATKAAFDQLPACVGRDQPVQSAGTLCAVSDASTDEVTAMLDSGATHSVAAYGLSLTERPRCYQYPWALPGVYDPLAALRTRVVRDGAPCPSSEAACAAVTHR